MFKHFFKSDFSKNVATLMGGTLIGQAIPFLSTFILTRIFTPDDFGLFAIYFSLVNIIGTVSTGRYEMAILLPKHKSAALGLLKISILSCLLVSVLLLGVLLLVGEEIAILLGNKELYKFLFLLPISVFGFGIYKTLSVWFTRLKKYRKISASIIVKSISGLIFNIGVGLYYGVIGLFLGNVLSSIIAVFILNPFEKGDYIIKKRRIHFLLRKYWKFPAFDVPSSFIYMLSKNGVVLLLSKGFSATITGHYSLTERLLIAPSQVFVGSYTQVYNQEVSEMFSKGKQIGGFVSRNIFKVAKLLAIPFIVGTYASPFLIPILLGKGWEVLYKYIFILSPFIFFSMILNPMSYVLKIKDRQDISFIQHLVLTAIKLLSLFISIMVFKLNVFIALLVYGILSILTLAFNANVIFNILELPVKKRLPVFLIALICVVMTLINMYFI